jgi:hypothetical protein
MKKPEIPVTRLNINDALTDSYKEQILTHTVIEVDGVSYLRKDLCVQMSADVTTELLQKVSLWQVFKHWLKSIHFCSYEPTDNDCMPDGLEKRQCKCGNFAYVDSHGRWFGFNKHGELR